MRGQPKYQENQIVSFKLGDEIKTGIIGIVDKYGTFENPTDASYDIFVTDENCFYKHITEKLIIE